MMLRRFGNKFDEVQIAGGTADTPHMPNDRFAATGEKRQRILAEAEQWPALPEASIAVIASGSLGYVSEVLRLADG